MTVNSHPKYGIRESSYGMGDIRYAQYMQNLLNKPAQSAAVGDTLEKPGFEEGFEPKVHKPSGVKTEIAGTASYVTAQTAQAKKDEIDKAAK